MTASFFFFEFKIAFALVFAFKQGLVFFTHKLEIGLKILFLKNKNKKKKKNKIPFVDFVKTF